MRFFYPLAALAFAVAANASSAMPDSIPFANTIHVEPGTSRAQLAALAAHVVPTPRQIAALDDGYIAFIHFGPNTFSRREWGTGHEDVTVFNPSALDTDQWAKTMKDAGMTKVILTAKHHDGYVIWNSRYTDHGIMGSPYMNGGADVMRSLAESCRKYGLKLGIYLSPADLYQIESPTGLYGNLSPKTTRTIPRKVDGRPFASNVTFEFEGIDDYNEYFLNQLYELLTEYGPIDEVWFDGAHPKTKGGQTYNYAAWRKLIRTLAPNAVVFGREDIRWCGNEGGATRDTEWNVIGYDVNPDTAQVFHDMMDSDLGSLDALAGKPYIHYQPTEVNTSIREGWFFRDDERQKSRSADDIFDMYERAVGGNAIFLLNIPPNREGRFSQVDVDALTEAGRRIRETYGSSILPSSDNPVIDGDLSTFVAASEPVVITLPEPVTINRFMIREPVADCGERIEEIALDAFIDGKWKEISRATNVGFKRIMRFPEITAKSFRLRVLASRLEPYIAEVSAYYYAPRPARLEASRSLSGMVTIDQASDGFGWNRYVELPPLPEGTVIYYTVDGSVPTSASKVYTGPFRLDSGTLRARASLHGEMGPELSQRFGFIKEDWKILGATSSEAAHPATAAIDANPTTFWLSEEESDAAIAIDMATPHTISGIIYTPQTRMRDGMIAHAIIETSLDGRSWRKAGEWELGNLINDPTPREYFLLRPVEARFIRITTLSTTSGTPISAIAELDIF